MKMRGAALGIKHSQLPPFVMRSAGNQSGQRLLRRATAAQQFQSARPKTRIGTVLR
jgi:hypothetical protein